MDLPMFGESQEYTGLVLSPGNDPCNVRRSGFTVLRNVLTVAHRT
jgi:hypothetical protein